jgi:hypothetical protein
LREERKVLISEYKRMYEGGRDQNKPFDVARLLAFLEATRPGLSWREAEERGRPFAAALENSCVDALRAAGLATPQSLNHTFQSSRFRYALKSFAASQGIATAQVSHLASVVLAVIVKDLGVVRHHFPNLLFDPGLATIVQKRVR